MRLSVISVCGSSRSHRLIGKSSATPANTLRKCALKFRMATSAAFLLWHPGGTNSICILHVSLMCSFMFSEISLSRTCLMGTTPALRNRVISASYARIISASFLLVIGSTRIALLSISTITMMYLLPRCDLVGNCPVWSVNMVSLVL